MTDTAPLTDQQLDDIRQRLAAAFEREDAQHWGYDHGFSADLDQCPETAAFVDVALAVVQPELDRLRAELAAARERLQSYGTPIKRFPPLPPEDPSYAKSEALRKQMEAGITEHAWAVGMGICPEGNGCTSGLLGVFGLTKRGRLPVHRSDYGPKCDGSGQKPAAVLRLAEPAANDEPAAGPTT